MNRYFGHIDKNGKLEIEFDENSFDCDVDIYVYPKIRSDKTVGEIFVEEVAGILLKSEQEIENGPAKKFLDNYAGFLKDSEIDVEDAKYQYLMDKYNSIPNKE